MVSEGIPTVDGGTPVPVEDFSYDGEGNRLSSHLSNLYLSDDHNRLTEDSDYVYGYDTKGNRISRTAKVGGVVEAYTFNSVNKLVAYDSGDGTVATYHYDALGRRIAKVVDGVATAYVYEEWNPYSSVANDILLEYSDGALTRRWLHGAKVDEPLAFEAYSSTTGAGTGAINEVFADRQGSILAVVDPITGTKAAEYTYDSFGQLTQVSGTLSQPFAYTAREYDAETGLYYYRARYYDPTIGQFIQADPIGFAAGDLNIYTYVENDPFNWSDPSGLGPADIIGDNAVLVMQGAALTTIGFGLFNALLETLELMNQSSHISDGWFSSSNNGGAGAGAAGAAGVGADTDTGTTTSDPTPPQCGPGGGGDGDNTDLEHTPKTHPEEFGPVRGSPAKINLATGEIWEFDRLHKDHYEVYKNKKMYEKGKRKRSIWEDGRSKDCF